MARTSTNPQNRKRVHMLLKMRVRRCPLADVVKQELLCEFARRPHIRRCVCKWALNRIARSPIINQYLLRKVYVLRLADLLTD